MKKTTRKRTLETLFLNKEIEIKHDIYDRDGRDETKVIMVSQNVDITYAQLILQIAKQQRGQEGVGDLEEQRIRFKLIDRMLQTKVGDPIVLEQREIDCIKKILPFWKLKIVSKGLIEFQDELMEELKK